MPEEFKEIWYIYLATISDITQVLSSSRVGIKREHYNSATVEMKSDHYAAGTIQQSRKMSKEIITSPVAIHFLGIIR